MILDPLVDAAGKLLGMSPQKVAVAKWKLARGDATLRLDYPLGPESVVFDVGGYRGDWAEAIARRFDCRIHVFEPIEAYCELIRARLGGNRKVTINAAGLADRTGACRISVDEAASSVMKEGGSGTRQIQLVDIAQYVAQHGIDRIDLIKINIEGGEYPLLARMDEIGLVPRCRDIQVQFHDFVPDAAAKREALRTMLARTHRITYDFPFIWENWRRRT